MDHKVLEKFQGLCILQTVRYVSSCDVHKFCCCHATVHEDTVKNVLLTDVRYLLIYVSKWAVLHCNPVKSLSSRTNLQVLVDSLSCPCPRAISPWIQHCKMAQEFPLCRSCVCKRHHIPDHIGLSYTACQTLMSGPTAEQGLGHRTRRSSQSRWGVELSRVE